MARTAYTAPRGAAALRSRRQRRTGPDDQNATMNAAVSAPTSGQPHGSPPGSLPGSLLEQPRADAVAEEAVDGVVNTFPLRQAEPDGSDATALCVATAESAPAVSPVPQPRSVSPAAPHFFPDDPTREPTPTFDVEVAQIEWALNAQRAQVRWAEAERERRERSERIHRLSLSDANAKLEAMFQATVASSGLEVTEQDEASAEDLFRWTLRAHRQIAKSAAARARTGTRRGGALSPAMLKSLWAASDNIIRLLDTDDPQE